MPRNEASRRRGCVDGSGDGAGSAPLGKWSLEATVLGWYPGHCSTPSTLPNRGERHSIPLRSQRCRPLDRRRCERSGGFQEETSSADGVAVSFGQRAQLPQGEGPSAARLGDDDARPQPLGPRQFHRLPRTRPSTRALAAYRLGLFVGNRRPTLGIAGAFAYRQPVPTHCGHVLLLHPSAAVLLGAMARIYVKNCSVATVTTEAKFRKCNCCWK